MAQKRKHACGSDLSIGERPGKVMDKGILFKRDNMAKAADEERKTQTRRMEGLDAINELPDTWRLKRYESDTGIAFFQDTDYGSELQVKCPFAKGQRLYLKETHWTVGHWHKWGKTKTGKQKWRFIWADKKICRFEPPSAIVHPNSYRKDGWYKRSKLFMAKKSARKWFVVTEDPRPERVQDISEADAIAEGLTEFFWPDYAAQLPNVAPDIAAGKRWWKHVIMKRGRESSVWDSPIKAFRELWIDIHGPDAWKLNFWLWASTFRKD